jgi:hypothetical protein
MKRLRAMAALTAAAAMTVLLGAPTATAASLPTGERITGGTVIEPAYDDANGSLVYLSTPQGATVHPNFAHNVAPIYLPVYPAGVNVGTLNCEDTTATTTENCPDHGPEVAGAAMAISASAGFGSVYANGVLGHDHLVGIASTGGDFNVLWEPVLILFTNTTAASQHVTTLSQVQGLLNSGNAIPAPLQSATFHCASVSVAVYNRGTPFTG